MGAAEFQPFHEPVLVFIVEDSDMYALMLEHKLKRSGNFKFKKFTSGEQCVEHIHENPQLIILDYNLTGMNGLETLRIIKQVNFSIPVVVISGQQDLKVAIDMFGAGAFEYIHKDSDTVHELYKTLDRISLSRPLRS